MKRVIICLGIFAFLWMGYITLVSFAQRRCEGEEVTSHHNPLRPTYIITSNDMWMRNTGGSDGSGLCVFTSMQHTFRYQNLPYDDFRRWMERHPGGGWPEKVDQMIQRYCKDKNLPEPNYVHIVGTSNYRMAVNILKEALRQGYLPCITWGTDCTTYNNSRIAHMVNVVYLDDEWGAICDNNAPNRILWVRRSQFDRNACLSGFWAMIFIDGGAIPCIASH